MNQKQPSNPPVSDRWSFLWLGIATILLVFTYGMYRNPVGACLAPVFLIRFLRSQQSLWGVVIGALAYVGVFALAW